MNEERIDKLVWEIHTKADAKRILLAVAAEARREGIEWMIQCAMAEVNNMMVNHPTATAGLREIRRRIKENGQAQLAKEAEWLKEKV